jgi:hypothetical protein
MNNSLFTVYSELYSTALMQDVKTSKSAAKVGNNRFSALVKLLRRG